jgi:hypothetical protein
MVRVVPQRVAHQWIKPQAIDFGGVELKRAWDNYIEQSVMVLKDDGSAESTEITESSSGKRGQDGGMDYAKAGEGSACGDDEAEEADLQKSEGEKG